jgi:hypothetical protein
MTRRLYTRDGRTLSGLVKDDRFAIFWGDGAVDIGRAEPEREIAVKLIFPCPCCNGQTILTRYVDGTMTLKEFNPENAG